MGWWCGGLNELKRGRIAAHTLVGWVANDKNTDIKDMQKSVQAMAINNSEMLAVMKEIVENDARQQARIDRNTEILSGIRK
jgi:hypothetical protein